VAYLAWIGCIDCLELVIHSLLVDLTVSQGYARLFPAVLSSCVLIAEGSSTSASEVGCMHALAWGKRREFGFGLMGFLGTAQCAGIGMGLMVTQKY